VNPERFLKLVGQNIRTARHLTSLSLERATSGRGAERFLREVESGKRNPSLTMLLALAVRFGVTPSDLVSVPGLRPGSVPLDEQEAEPPPRGRPRKKKTKTAAKKKTAKKRRSKQNKKLGHR